jgi:serine/threonine protein kinase
MSRHIAQIGQYILTAFLGAGTSGGVWECYRSGTNEVYACKVVTLDLMMQDEYYRHFVNELRIHSQIRHPCIIELKDVMIDSTSVYLFMEVCQGGDLNEVVQQHGGLTEELAKRYFHHVMSALAHIHRLGIAHRDIKLENVLVTSDGRAKLTDFGLCRTLPPESGMVTVCGTLVYAAPEIVREEPYGLPVDIWSAGVLLYAMVACHFPWSTEDNLPTEMVAQETSRQILEGIFEFPDSFSFDLVNLIGSMMALNPSDRPTAEQVLMHPWMSQENDVTIGCNTDSNPGLVALVDSAITDLEALRPK